MICSSVTVAAMDPLWRRASDLHRICTTRIGRIPHMATQPVVHRHRVGHHRRIRRPDTPVGSTCTLRNIGYRRHGVTASMVAERGRACTPTSPAITSTSWPPAATSKWCRSGRRRRRRPPVEALRRVDSPDAHHRLPGAHRRPVAVAARQGARPAARTTRPRRWPRRSAPEYGRAMAAGLTGDELASRAAGRSARRCRPWPTR